MANKTGTKPKGSGRTKGTPNKRTQNAKELAEQLGVDPLEILLRAAAGDYKFFGFQEKSLKIGKAVVRDFITFEDRVNAAADAAPYIYGKRRYVDEEGNTGIQSLEKILNEIDGTISEEDESE